LLVRGLSRRARMHQMPAAVRLYNMKCLIGPALQRANIFCASPSAAKG
jgi:hypothetical protein